MPSTRSTSLFAPCSPLVVCRRVERAIHNELDLDGITICDAFPCLMHVGDVIRLLIRDHLADFDYHIGRIPLGRELPLALRFFRESAHDCLMTLALVGVMEWRVDEDKRIHFWSVAIDRPLGCATLARDVTQDMPTDDLVALAQARTA